MIYITGDTHGEIARFTPLNLPLSRFQPEDTLIVAGDFGYLFGNYYDERKLSTLEKLNFTIAFVDGNHECFPKIYSFPEEEWNGGRIHRIRPNIVHLMRGQVFTLEGLTIFTMGGGFSLDQAFRVPGVSWWPEELPTQEEYDRGQENLSAHGNQVDVIVSHTAPMDTMKVLYQRGSITKNCYEEARLNNYLQDVVDTVSYQQYYFGHLHLDCPLWRRQTALLYAVYCLNTGEKIWPEE